MAHLRSGCRVAALAMAAALLAAPARAADSADPALHCQHRKLRASAREIRRRVSCETVARVRSTFDPDACLAEAASERAAAYASIESKGGCDQTGDSDAVGASAATSASQAVADVASILTPHCGNGIVNPGEDCDGSYPEDGLGCSPAGDPNACHACVISYQCYDQDLIPHGPFPCCDGKVCLVDNLFYPHKTGTCAAPCTTHSDCPTGQLCFPGGGCAQPGPPCTDTSDCNPPWSVCHPTQHVCAPCDQFGNCWGPLL